MAVAMPQMRMFEAHLAVCDLGLARLNAGTCVAASRVMMTITTSNSVRVKPGGVPSLCEGLRLRKQNVFIRGLEPGDSKRHDAVEALDDSGRKIATICLATH